MRLKFFNAKSTSDSSAADAEDETYAAGGDSSTTKQYNFAGQPLEAMMASTFGRAATEPARRSKNNSPNQRERAHTLADVMQLFEENGQTISNESFRIKANGAIVRNRPPTIFSSGDDAILPASEISMILSSAVSSTQDKEDNNTQSVQMQQEASGSGSSGSNGSTGNRSVIVHNTDYFGDQQSEYSSSDTSVSSHGHDADQQQDDGARLYLTQGSVVTRAGKEPDHPTPLRPPPRSVNNLAIGSQQQRRGGHRTRENSSNTDICEALVLQDDKNPIDWESMYYAVLQENIHLRQQIQVERERHLSEKNASVSQVVASQLEIRHLQRALSLTQRLNASNIKQHKSHHSRRRSMGDFNPLLDYTDEVEESLCLSKSSVPARQKLKILLDEIEAFQAQEDMLITKQRWLQQQKSQLEQIIKDKDELIQQLQHDLAIIS